MSFLFCLQTVLWLLSNRKYVIEKVARTLMDDANQIETHRSARTHHKQEKIWKKYTISENSMQFFMHSEYTRIVFVTYFRLWHAPIFILHWIHVVRRHRSLLHLLMLSSHAEQLQTKFTNLRVFRYIFMCHAFLPAQKCEYEFCLHIR